MANYNIYIAINYVPFYFGLMKIYALNSFKYLRTLRAIHLIKTEKYHTSIIFIVQSLKNNAT